MTPAEKLRANIRALMKDHDNMSIRGLARQADISKSALSDFLSEKNSSLSFDSMTAIAVEFDTSVGALLGEEPAGGPVESIPLPSLYSSDLNPRKHFSQPAIQKLALDIKASGILQNLVVRTHPDKPGAYLVVAGHRRLLAVEILDAAGDWPANQGLPCKIIEANDRDHILTALSENLEREDLDPLEEAGAYKVLVEEYGMTPLEIGGRFARDKRHILYRLKLLDLNDKAVIAMRQGIFGPGIGRHIARLTDHSQGIIIDRLLDGTLETTESAVIERVKTMLGPYGGTEPDRRDIEDPPAGETTDAGPAYQRANYFGDNGDAYVWACQDSVAGRWTAGYFCLPAAVAAKESLKDDLGISFANAQTALGCAAQTLATALGAAIADTNPALDKARGDMREIRAWADRVSVERGGDSMLDEPGEDSRPEGVRAAEEQIERADIEAADPPGESNEGIAGHAVSAGVEQRDPAEYAQPEAHPTLADTIEMGEDGWPVPKPGYFIEHPRAVDPELQFIRTTTRGIGEMPDEISLYDPKNQAHAEYVRKDEE